ncbi:MAG: hypothetical protein HYX43_16865 [Burkholderiales bacterium]|nr:hypothetical protein [Burkholderiales bacterium]
MRPVQHTLLATALLCSVISQPALADTTLSGSVSDSISTAVGSVSTSLKKSSQSSTKDNKVAEGDYKVMALTAEADQPGMVRMTLQALAVAGREAGPDERFELILPQKTVALNQVVAGATVTARNRPYGMAFATGEPRQDFFLVMQDDWYRELPSKPVVL